jgi:cysteinyl-tRNA synthetase
MLRLYNTFGRKLLLFRPVRKDLVTVFTCGPSVYQRAHVGNFRTFLFEDILVRYLEFSGYKVRRGLIFTDIEDKAVLEADREHAGIRQLTGKNIRGFLKEMELLKIKPPDYLPKASESVDQAVEIIQLLLRRKIAYWHKGNVYFDPLKFSGFGKLFGLDMSKWPKKKVRFHKDTYPGVQWNFGDFILWHGYKKGEKAYWDTSIGRGRPSWNIQDPAMVSRFFDETLSIYCGGIDNLYRHHDYTLAILESIRPYPMARFWLHGHHLLVSGRKMSKSRGNIYYTDMLSRDGFSMQEVRFFLIYGHYRKDLNFSKGNMTASVDTLRKFKRLLSSFKKSASSATRHDNCIAGEIVKIFSDHMDNDLSVKEAFDGVNARLSDLDKCSIKSSEAAGVIRALKKIDEVLQVIF